MAYLRHWRQVVDTVVFAYPSVTVVFAYPSVRTYIAIYVCIQNIYEGVIYFETYVNTVVAITSKIVYSISFENFVLTL